MHQAGIKDRTIKFYLSEQPNILLYQAKWNVKDNRYMINLSEVKNQCTEIINKAPELPLEFKKYCVSKELKAYIPFIGDKYGQYTKILFLCTAQNLAGNRDVLKEYVDDEKKSLYRLYPKNTNPLFVDVGPVAGGVLPALGSALLFLLDKIRIRNLEECMQYIAFTNFYKFSLQTENFKDLNPGKLDSNLKEEYDTFMLEHYVKKEIEALKPDYIFCFRPCYKILKECIKKPEPILINDPAWLLRGARGIKKWEEEIIEIEKDEFDHQVEELIDLYCDYIGTKDPHPNYYYKNKAKQIGIYIKHCYYFILKG